MTRKPIFPYQKPARSSDRADGYTVIMVKPSYSAKSSKSLIFKVANGKPCAKQHAAIQQSLTGRARPRRSPAAANSPHTRVMASVLCITGILSSHRAMRSRRRAPSAGAPPLGEFTLRDERDTRFEADELPQRRRWKLAFEAQ